MKKIIFSLIIIFMFNNNIFSMQRSCENLDLSCKKTELKKQTFAKKELTDEFLFSLIETTPNKEFIKYINLSNNNLITDLSIVLITQNFPNLKILKLNNCSSLTNKSLEILLEFIDKYHKLTVIYVKNNKFIPELIELIKSKNVVILN